jgi:hypothetical protein
MPSLESQSQLFDAQKKFHSSVIKFLRSLHLQNIPTTIPIRDKNLRAYIRAMVSCKALKDDGVFLREVLGLVEFIMKEPRVVGMGGEDARKHVRYRALVEQGEGGTIREMGRALEWLEECEGVVGV